MKVDNIDIYCFNPDIISPRLVANVSLKNYDSRRSYKVKKITGLDAEEISSKFYGFTYMTNRKSYSMNASKRHVSFKIELKPNYGAGETVSSLRDNFYRAISSSRAGDIYVVFKKGTDKIARLSGHFTKFESDLFAEIPEIQFTISCPDSMLKSENEVEIDISEFSTDAFTVVDNVSTAPHGLRFAVDFVGPCNKFTIAEPITFDWKFEIVPGFITPEIDGFIVGDKLIFSSIPGSRELQILRDDVYYHIVDKITPGAFWPMLFPGTNTFDVDGTNFTWDWMRHYYTYWGV